MAAKPPKSGAMKIDERSAASSKNRFSIPPSAKSTVDKRDSHREAIRFNGSDDPEAAQAFVPDNDASKSTNGQVPEIHISGISQNDDRSTYTMVLENQREVMSHERPDESFSKSSTTLHEATVQRSATPIPRLQLNKWVYEASNTDITVTERLEKSNWAGEICERL